MNGLTVTRLGEITLAAKQETDAEKERIDPAPIVLWAGQNPAAVLTFRQHTHKLIWTVTQEIRRTDKQSGPFPITKRATFLPGHSEDEMDMVNNILTGDVDGDGVDDLVLVRQLGGIEVYSLQRELHRMAGPSPRPEVASYELASWQKVRLKSREVLYLLFKLKEHKRVGTEELAKLGIRDRHILVRIDQQGITRVALEEKGGTMKEVLAVGALNRPGTDEVSELMVCSTRAGDEGVTFSRHRPDGTAIGEPRKIHAPFLDDHSNHFEFLSQSDKAMLVGGTAKIAYFVTPDKPANWIRAVDLSEHVKTGGTIDFLQVSDAQKDPKQVFRVENEIYAVNEEGKYFTVSGGAWVSAGKKPVPFTRIAPPSPLHELAGVLPSQTDPDELLVMYTRKRQPKKLSNEELLRYGERFLVSSNIEAEKAKLVPTLEGRSLLRDDLMADERKKRGIKRKITSVEEWKTYLPDSYEAMVREKESYFYTSIEVDLTRPMESSEPIDEEQYRNLDEYREWLKGLEVPAETTFTIIRKGARAPSFVIPIHHPRLIDGNFGPVIDFRSRASDLTVVMPLETGDDVAKEQAGFFVIQRDGE